MAVDLSKLIVKRKIELAELNNRVIAIDAYNMLYQFLTTIRQPDGNPLTDSKGNVTSHLSGLFYRTIDLISNGIKPIYVFDGIPSVLKERTIGIRIRKKEQAYEAWQKAKEAGEMEEAKSHARASTRMTKDIAKSARELLGDMGVYCISAPGEGEAQASYMCRKGLVYAAASQDYDTLLFGSPRVARNISISGRRKLPNKNFYINVVPELVDLNDTLNSLGINQEKLIWIGLMLGTDFNEGIKGIGPKTALKIVKDSDSIKDVEARIKEKYEAGFEPDIDRVIELFRNPEIVEISGDEINKGINLREDKEKILKFMCDEHDFDVGRVAKQVDALSKMKGSSRQQSMSSWFER